MDCLKLGYLQILGIYSSKLEESGLGLYISFLILPLRISFLSFFFFKFSKFYLERILNLPKNIQIKIQIHPHTFSLSCFWFFLIVSIRIVVLLHSE